MFLVLALYCVYNMEESAHVCNFHSQMYNIVDN